MTTDNEKNENTASPAATEVHPLLAAFQDLKRTAVLQRGLRVLARIQFGKENREAWIANRQSQIDKLDALGLDAMDAYTRGDDDDMKQIMKEVDAIVGMNEGMSAAEAQIAESEVLDEQQEYEGPFPPKEKLPFKGNRRKGTYYT